MRVTGLNGFIAPPEFFRQIAVDLPQDKNPQASKLKANHEGLECPTAVVCYNRVAGVGLHDVFPSSTWWIPGIPPPLFCDCRLFLCSTRCYLAVPPACNGSIELDETSCSEAGGSHIDKNVTLGNTARSLITSRAVYASFGLDDASCPEAGRSHPGHTPPRCALSTQHGSNPWTKTTVPSLHAVPTSMPC